MQLESHISEPRSKFIARFTAVALRQSGVCIRKFSTCVADQYFSRVAEHERVVKFHRGQGSTDSAFKAEKRNAQLVQRFLDGTVKFPADLEESWVAALPDQQRTELVRELAARYGLAAARIPGHNGRHPVADLAAILRDAGDTATALAPAYADGKLDSDDRAHILNALPVISRAIADFTSMQAQLAQALELDQRPTLRAAS
ncbi:MAG TPA: hypothetical protein VFE79_03860 [Paraburkholderia sp.]|jgi:hypothetical protein|nr:hypothetical protein [Paraburkholderia sp.]